VQVQKRRLCRPLCMIDFAASSPAIALVIQLLVALLAIVVASAGRVKQVLPSDEVDPCTDLQQQSRSII